MNNVKQALMWVVLSGSLTFYFRALSCVCVCVYLSGGGRELVRTSFGE